MAAPIRVARAEKRRYEEALKKHTKGCLSCYRWSTGRVAHQLCDVGIQLSEAISMMDRQVQLLAPPPQPEYVQDALW